MTDHERADCGVDVLRITAVPRKRQAERARFLPQTADRVDLPVVREDWEGLHAREARRRVRGVAVVPERDRGGEQRVGEVGEIGRELVPRPAELVHGGMAREAHHRGGRRSLDVDAGLVERTRSEGRTARRQEGELEEPRSLGASARTERGLIRGLRPYEERLDAATAEDRDDRGDVGRIVVEEVTDREPLELHSALVMTSAVEHLRP